MDGVVAAAWKVWRSPLGRSTLAHENFHLAAYEWKSFWRVMGSMLIHGKPLLESFWI